LERFFLALSRLFQSFFAAGELSGGAVCLLEKKTLDKHQILSTLYSSSTILGIILASAATAFLAWQGNVQEKWRYLYLLGAATGVIGAFIPIEKVQIKKQISISLKEHIMQLKAHKQPFLWIVIASGFSYSCYSAAFIASHALLPFVTHLSADKCAPMNSILLTLDLFLFPLFAYAAKYFNSFNTMKASAFGAGICGIFLFTRLGEADWLEVFFLRFAMVFLGVAFSAYFHAWSLQVAPKAFRQTTISLAYSLGSQSLGAPTAFLTLLLYQKTGSLLIASLYWVILGLAASYCVQRSERVYYTAKKVFL